MQIDESIFKAYDIRGTYPDQINEELVKRIGKAFGIFTQNFVARSFYRVVVGRDGRNSSSALMDAFIKGVRSVGGDIVDIGLVSTDAMYFAIGKHNYDGGVMVSASHNPKEYGGLKMLVKGEKIKALS